MTVGSCLACRVNNFGRANRTQTALVCARVNGRRMSRGAPTTSVLPSAPGKASRPTRPERCLTRIRRQN